MTSIDPASSLRKTIGAGLRFKVLAKSGFACRYCGRRAPDVVLHIDHIVPVALGGRHVEQNMTAACSDCNLGKGTATVVLAPMKKRLASKQEWHVKIVAAAYSANRKRCRDSFVIKKMLDRLDGAWLLELVTEAREAGKAPIDALAYMFGYAFPAYRGEVA